MDRIEFEKQNPNLEWVTLGGLKINKDSSLDLDNLTISLSSRLPEKKDIAVYLEYSPSKKTYSFRIYNEKTIP